LEGRNAQRIEVHLRTCGRCQDEVIALRRLTQAIHALPSLERPEAEWQQAVHNLRGKLHTQVDNPAASPWVAYFGGMLESPAQAMVSMALIGVALVNTLIFLGVRDEAFDILAAYLLPLVLD
jgi:anti-sigma factor RsiW